jgi:hypothetical protein
MPYVADSSLFADYGSQSILVLGPTGRVARSMAPLNSRGPPIRPGLNSGGVDDRGRVIYLSPIRTEAGLGAAGDSVALIRVDLETRRVDTLASLNRNPTRVSHERLADGTPVVTLVTNPLPAIDEWAVLTDGSIAIVRGHDYHIDWIRPDGRRESTPRMPFDWKRLLDEDKQKLIDSARSALAASLSSTATGGGASRSAGGDRGRGGDAGAMANPGMLKREFVSPKSIADFYPAIRPGATLPDRDGNLWILPATSARSLHGELVYDVVNAKGELFRRVRAPIGRAVGGFGRGGVVFLISGDPGGGVRLERTKL